MIRTVTIKQSHPDDEVVVVFSTGINDESAETRRYSTLDFGVAQAIEDFLATGEVSNYSN